MEILIKSESSSSFHHVCHPCMCLVTGELQVSPAPLIRFVLNHFQFDRPKRMKQSWYEDGKNREEEEQREIQFSGEIVTNLNMNHAVINITRHTKNVYTITHIYYKATTLITPPLYLTIWRRFKKIISFIPNRGPPPI